MKIIALSDNHGMLPKLNAIGDVLVIAGDWSPLSIQWSYLDMIKWIDNKFIPWMLGINVNHIVFIPGNHDLVCTSKSFTRDFNKLLKKHHTNKIHFLNRSSITIDGIKFYGIPDCEMTQTHWAFTKMGNIDWTCDIDTDILITHQPPQLGKVAYIDQYKQDFGSIDLYRAIKNSNIAMNVCGHIHEGEHGKHLMVNKQGEVSVYNVSLLNEDYKLAYPLTKIEI